MADHYAAFISYAHRDQAWVGVLQENLERCLQAAGRPGNVFLDEIDLASGRSWVGQLQTGLGCSDQIVLVATPEAMASPRVADEWRSFIGGRPDWHLGKLHIVQLAEVPLPPFLGQIQSVDFREAGEERYRRSLQRLVAGLLDHSDNRNLPSLPVGIEIPAPPSGRLPATLRSRLVEWLTPVLAKKMSRLAVAQRLNLKPEALEDQGSWECAASAVLVWATRQEDSVAAALRVVDTLKETLDEDEPEQVAQLAPLREELAALQAESPQRDLLTRWLQSVARDHERLVPLQEQIDLGLLDRVYVQLQVRPGGRAGAVAEPRLPSSLTLPGLLGLDRSEHPWVTGRWIIFGDPGAGKTTLLRHLTATLAGREGRPWVPVFDSLPRLLRDHSSLLDRAVRRLEHTSRQPAQDLAETLERIGRDGHLLLLLDGLDEVPRESREDAEKLLRDLSMTWPRTPLVVASRPIGYRSPGSEFREVEILPLDRDHRRELLARFLGRAEGSLDTVRAEQTLQSLEAADLGELAGNPLYLSLMALLVEQGIAPERNRPHLYDQVFDLLLDGKYRPGVEPMERKNVVRAVLQELACGMTEDNRDSEPVEALEDRLYRPVMDTLRGDLERIGRWRGRMRQFLIDLGERTGILGPHDGEAADWRFWHRTFREALTAEHLWGQHRSAVGQAAVLARARAITAEEDQSRWAEPFALLAGRVEDPDGLVKALVEANLPLGLRALATTQRLRTETVRKVLALSKQWDERAEVYRHLPELVGEARRSLTLLDQLRRQTRNGNDLYFLEGAVRAVARRSPEQAREAEALLARFFDHIPSPPDEELFRWVESPHGGRVPLWREISAGRFFMGTYGGSGWSHERPRHEVTITGSFLCGAAPVTNGQYAIFDPEHQVYEWGGVPAEELAHHPVVGVTWFEAVSFCRWLSAAFLFCRGARLPVEEEWEYTCRAGSESRYWKGDEENDLASVGWYDRNSGSRTHRVGEKPPNPWGLYDVHGNVLEWTLSLETEGYKSREGGFASDPSAVEMSSGEAPHGSGRVMRGGGCRSDAGRTRSAFRLFWDPGIVLNDRGFRVVVPSVPEPRL